MLVIFSSLQVVRELLADPTIKDDITAEAGRWGKVTAVLLHDHGRPDGAVTAFLGERSPSSYVLPPSLRLV
jgi:hypothetical protein